MACSFPALNRGSQELWSRSFPLASGGRYPSGPAPQEPLAPPTAPLAPPHLAPALPAPCPCPREPRIIQLSAPWEEDEIRRDRVEPQSVSLSWREPIPAGAPGANGTEYEIRYFEKVSLGLGGIWGCIATCDLSPSSAGFLFFTSPSQSKSSLLCL